MFVYKHAKMNTKSSVQPYAQCQPHDKANHRYCSGARMAPSRHCDKHRNAATYHQSLAATAGAGCSSNRWSAGLRSEKLHQPAMEASSDSVVGKSLARRLIDLCGR